MRRARGVSDGAWLVLDRGALRKEGGGRRGVGGGKGPSREFNLSLGSLSLLEAGFTLPTPTTPGSRTLRGILATRSTSTRYRTGSGDADGNGWGGGRSRGGREGVHAVALVLLVAEGG